MIGGDSELVAASWLGDHAVVLADLAGTVRVVDAASGRELAGMTGTAPVGALAVSRDASHVALGGLDGRLEVRDAMLARPVVLAAPGASAVTAVAFAPDGTRVVSGHADGSTRLWDSTTGAQVAIRPDPELVDEPTDHEGHAALAFTPDGARILAVRPAGKTLVLAATDLATRATLDGRMVGELAPDGHHLAAALGDGAILVHDLDGGAPLRLTGERGIVVTAAFSADGGRLVAGAIDGSVRVWSVAGTPPAATPIAPVATIAATGLGSATALAVTGDAIVAGYASGAVRVHPANPLAALARACAVAARFGRERETSPYCSGWAASERR